MLEISKTQNEIRSRERKIDHEPNKQRRRSIGKVTKKARHNEKTKQGRERIICLTDLTKKMK